MPDRHKRLEELNKKLARLRELKKKIEQKIKKERALAIRYAKEIAFYYLEASGESEKTGKPYEEIALEYLKEAICSRAKNKERCLYRKLKLIVEYESEFKKAHKLAKHLLRYLEKSGKGEG